MWLSKMINNYIKLHISNKNNFEMNDEAVNQSLKIIFTIQSLFTKSLREFSSMLYFTHEVFFTKSKKLYLSARTISMFYSSLIT